MHLKWTLIGNRAGQTSREVGGQGHGQRLTTWKCPGKPNISKDCRKIYLTFFNSLDTTDSSTDVSGEVRELFLNVVFKLTSCSSEHSLSRIRPSRLWTFACSKSPLQQTLHRQHKVLISNGFMDVRSYGFQKGIIVVSPGVVLYLLPTSLLFPGDFHKSVENILLICCPILSYNLTSGPNHWGHPPIPRFDSLTLTLTHLHSISKVTCWDFNLVVYTLMLLSIFDLTQPYSMSPMRTQSVTSLYEGQSRYTRVINIFTSNKYSRAIYISVFWCSSQSTSCSQGTGLDLRPLRSSVSTQGVYFTGILDPYGS